MTSTCYAYQINPDNPPSGHTQVEIYDEMTKYNGKWLTLSEMCKSLDVQENIIKGTVPVMKRKGHLLHKDTGIKRGIKKKLTEEKFLELYREGKDDKEIAEEVHVHWVTVRKIRQNLKLPSISQLRKEACFEKALELVLEALEGDE